MKISIVDLPLAWFQLRIELDDFCVFADTDHTMTPNALYKLHESAERLGQCPATFCIDLDNESEDTARVTMSSGTDGMTRLAITDWVEQEIAPRLDIMVPTAQFVDMLLHAINQYVATTSLPLDGLCPDIEKIYSSCIKAHDSSLDMNADVTPMPQKPVLAGKIEGVNLSGASREQYPEIVALWESSVRATHAFLREEDIAYFKPLILEKYLDAVTLRCVLDSSGSIIGFIGVSENKIEMLFVSPSCFGQGVGTLLLRHAVADLGATMVDVNEQNLRAVAFYQGHGFVTTGRSATDGTGKPYPLLHMQLAKNLSRLE